HGYLFASTEIEKFQKGEGKDEEKYIDVVINKNMKLGQKVLIPVKQFPKIEAFVEEEYRVDGSGQTSVWLLSSCPPTPQGKRSQHSPALPYPFVVDEIATKEFSEFNFVGKLLGPRGNSLKRLQEETLTKMSILGKGSMRDKAKEEELRKSGEAKYFHLNDDLHVLIEVFAPPAEAYARMGHALEEIKKFLIPDYNDEIRQAQLQELTYLNGGSENADVPVVRGKPTLRTRGVPTPAITRGRGTVTARPVGVGVPRGTPTTRGVLSTRGPVSRGRGLLTPRARGVPPTGYRPPPPPPAQEAYGEYPFTAVSVKRKHHEVLIHRIHWDLAPCDFLYLFPKVKSQCKDYDDGYGTAYDEQSYDSYDNSYSTPAQSTWHRPSRSSGTDTGSVHTAISVHTLPEQCCLCFPPGTVGTEGSTLYCQKAAVIVEKVSDILKSGTDYYDYGHGLSEETYDSYGQEEWTNSRHKAPSARTAKGVYRDQPYGRY
ncbi:KH domain-containing, RNA-binding, signal transduction-associated protein 3, partial [Fukomys damarensis]